jgi:eukaryotic-like serine/threonine-protein kinase
MLKAIVSKPAQEDSVERLRAAPLPVAVWSAPGDRAKPLDVGRYRAFKAVASGGMATVYIGYVVSEVSSHPVAIKRLHAHCAADADLVTMLLDEARIATAVQHPNVVSVQEVVSVGSERFLIMPFVQGASLHQVLTADRDVPDPILVRILIDVLEGLHAAHEACDLHGKSMDIVHRDISPQNVMVDVLGFSRVVDFGIAKASDRQYATETGLVRGKIAYMAPEQMFFEPVDCRADVFAAGMVLWELLVGERPFANMSREERLMLRTLNPIRAPLEIRACNAALSEIVVRATARNPDSRFGSAREMARALMNAATPASHDEVARWILPRMAEFFSERAEDLKEMERWAAKERLALKQERVADDSDGINVVHVDVDVALPAERDVSAIQSGLAVFAAPPQRSVGKGIGIALGLAGMTFLAVAFSGRFDPVKVRVEHTRSLAASALPISAPPIVVRASASVALLTPSPPTTKGAPSLPSSQWKVKPVLPVGKKTVLPPKSDPLDPNNPH